MEEQIGFESCLTDPYVWQREATRKNDSKYWEYVLLYVDDVLVVHHSAEGVLKRLDKYFKLKPGSVGDPDIYLGATSSDQR